MPPRVRRLMEDRKILIPPIVGLELQYLFETDRTSEPAAVAPQALTREAGRQVCNLLTVATATISYQWMRLLSKGNTGSGLGLLADAETVATDPGGKAW